MSSLELIFIHIHKTGGKSVSEVLHQHFGKHYARINRSYLRRQGSPRVEMGMRQLDTSTRALAGHFKFGEIEHLVTSETKLVTWMRDPVERVLSHHKWYNFQSQNSGHGKTIDLESFLEMDVAQNWMSKFLKGSSIEDYYFIGFLEEMSEDVSVLGKLLSDQPWQAVHVNQNPLRKVRQMVSHEIRQKIEDANQEDLELFERAKCLRRH